MAAADGRGHQDHEHEHERGQLAEGHQLADVDGERGQLADGRGHQDHAPGYLVIPDDAPWHIRQRRSGSQSRRGSI